MGDESDVEGSGTTNYDSRVLRYRSGRYGTVTRQDVLTGPVSVLGGGWTKRSETLELRKSPILVVEGDLRVRGRLRRS